MNNKHQLILNEIKKRNIPLEVKKMIIPILEKNIDRIQFVKNFVGLRDILYFEELEVDFFDFPFFLSLDCQTLSSTGGNKHESIASVYENAITDANEIVRKLNYLFQETERRLYIEIAFTENILTNDDMWKVYHQMPIEIDKEPFEIMVKMYKYPQWYDAEYGQEIAVIEDSIYALKQIERIKLSKLIYELESNINKSLELNELDTFTELVKEFKILKKQID